MYIDPTYAISGRLQAVCRPPRSVMRLNRHISCQLPTPTRISVNKSGQDSDPWSVLRPIKVLPVGIAVPRNVDDASAIP